MNARKQIIATLLRRGRPNLANAVVHGRTITAGAKDLGAAAVEKMRPFVKMFKERKSEDGSP